MGRCGSASFLKVLVNNFDALAGPLVSLAYPLYASVKAIETRSAVDDQQWLTYWVLYSFITLFELTFAPILEWLPFWSYAKLFFNCWLVLPQFNGAAHVYEHFMRPVIVNQEAVNTCYTPKRDGSERHDDVISAAQRYKEQNGSEWPDDVISAAQRYKEQNGSEWPDDVISAALRYIEQNGSKTFENLVKKLESFCCLLQEVLSFSVMQFSSSNPRRSILEEVEVERRARIEREAEAREMNPFFNQDYRY